MLTTDLVMGEAKSVFLPEKSKIVVWTKPMAWISTEEVSPFEMLKSFNVLDKASKFRLEKVLINESDHAEDTLEVDLEADPVAEVVEAEVEETDLAPIEQSLLSASITSLPAASMSSYFYRQ